jgi:glycine cleavage system regulatory protein
MTASLVLTIIGEDHPGLVQALADTVAAHHGNWLESRMSLMAGKFAGIARVNVPDQDAEGLTRALAELEARGLRVVVERAAARDAEEGFTQVTLELVGMDHPGIVRDISQVLSRRGVNIEELVTECSSAPMSGEPLFRATARLHLPAGLATEELRADLEEVAHSLMVDLRLADVPAPPGSD